ncbi:MAG: FtsQ-type POTRA domain-containing protein [Candidatus Microthrix parvicella]
MSRGSGSRPTGVDPRMRARRIGVTRGRARRRLRLAIGVGVTTLLVGVATVVYATPLRGVRTVEVNGVNEASSAEVLRALGDVKGRPVLRVDAADLTRQVAALPGMADADVTVSVLGTVTVTVSDDRPVAYVPTTKGAAALVGPTGRVLSLRNEVPQDLVRVEATVEPSVGGAVPKPMLAAVDVAAALPADLVAVTVAVGVGDDGVELELLDGVRARVGTTDQLDRKLAAVSTLLSGRVVLDCLKSINATEPSLVTISRDSACSGGPV